MLLFLLTVLIAVAGIVYCISACIVIGALKRVRKGCSFRKESVSVIISARNERRTLGACLAALAVQDYPQNLLEIVVADDRSTDGTSDVIRRFQRIMKNLSRITVERVPEGVSPKKNALAQAIEHSTGDIILQTDADCEPPSTWISGMAGRFGQGVRMVAGIAPYFKESGLLNSFVRHEYLWNAALSASSIALGRGTHVSGRNLAFRRDMFERAEGYGPMKNVLSGDDTLLLHRFQRMDSSSAVTMPSSTAHVPTHAPGTFRSFLRQRIRHMSTGKYFDPAHIFMGFFIYGYHLLLISALFFSFVSKAAPAVFLAGFIWKCLWDAAVAYRTETVLELDVEWRRFPLNELFLTFYMALMPVLGVFVPVKWKENS